MITQFQDMLHSIHLLYVFGDHFQPMSSTLILSMLEIISMHLKKDKKPNILQVFYIQTTQPIKENNLDLNKNIFYLQPQFKILLEGIKTLQNLMEKNSIGITFPNKLLFN